MTRRRPLNRLLGVVAAVAGLLVAAGCGGGAGPEAQARGTTGGSDGPTGGKAQARITFQLKAEPEEAAVYRSLVTAYGQQGGGGVTLVPVGRKDHLTRLSTSFASGSPPDVFLINYREYAPFVVRGAVEPVAPLLRQTGVDLGSYYEEPLRAFTYRGALQCMPQNISSLVVYWNRDLFATAGVPAPTADWSWADFTDAARALTRTGVKGLGIEPSITRMAPVVWGNGGRIVDDTVNPTRTTLHEPAAREALETMLRLAREDKVAPDKTQVAAQALEEQFMTGKLAMFMSSRVEVPKLREQRGLDFDVAPLPGLRQPSSILHSDAYCISRTSKNKEAAARFVAYATGQQGQTITAMGGRTVPSLRSVATSPAFLSAARKPQSSQVFLDAVPHLQHTPVSPAWPEVEDIIETQLARAFEDGVPLDEVLAEIRAQADPLLRQR
jgi:multiple sugar transport system substrate-binding protein